MPRVQGEEAQQSPAVGEYAGPGGERGKKPGVRTRVGGLWRRPIHPPQPRPGFHFSCESRAAGTALYPIFKRFRGNSQPLAPSYPSLAQSEAGLEPRSPCTSRAKQRPGRKLRPRRKREAQLAPGAPRGEATAIVLRKDPGGWGGGGAAGTAGTEAVPSAELRLLQPRRGVPDQGWPPCGAGPQPRGPAG